MNLPSRGKPFRPRRFSTLNFTSEQIERIGSRELTISKLQLDNKPTQLFVEIIESSKIEDFESIIGLTEVNQIRFKITIQLGRTNTLFLEENKLWSEIYG